MTHRSSRLHVVAGVLRDSEGRVLIAQRLPGTHLAGLWEFPGGKCEADESPETALRRELLEELDIEIGATRPLIRIPWDYAEKSLLLDVHIILDYVGSARSREGQALRWVDPERLRGEEMPAADRPVIAALRLPARYLITPSPSPIDPDDFLGRLATALRDGIRLVQLRLPSWPREQRVALARRARVLCTDFGAKLLINAEIDLVGELGLDGVHLAAAAIAALATRPLANNLYVGVSCHNATELDNARRIGADFVTLSPVRPTTSHPDVVALGWENFSALVAQCPLPVYALGGLLPEDLMRARTEGAIGIAGISGFWPGAQAERVAGEDIAG
jgi:8-oxo-dGTP diphosphatase